MKMSWQTGIQRMNSEAAPYQNIKSRNDSVRAQLGAAGELTADTARMTRYAPVGALRNLALQAGTGMDSTAKYIREGGNDENQIRRRANADLTWMLRTVDTAGGAAREQALTQAKSVMEDLSTVGQFETSQEASKALSILSQREGYVSTVQPAFATGGAGTTQVSQPGGPMQAPDAKTPVLDGAPAAPKVSDGGTIPVVTANSPNVYSGQQGVEQSGLRQQYNLETYKLENAAINYNKKQNEENRNIAGGKNVLNANEGTLGNTLNVSKKILKKRLMVLLMHKFDYISPNS